MGSRFCWEHMWGSLAHYGNILITFVRDVLSEFHHWAHSGLSYSRAISHVLLQVSQIDSFLGDEDTSHNFVATSPFLPSLTSLAWYIMHVSALQIYIQLPTSDIPILLAIGFLLLTRICFSELIFAFRSRSYAFKHMYFFIYSAKHSINVVEGSSGPGQKIPTLTTKIEKPNPEPYKSDPHPFGNLSLYQTRPP